MRIIHTMLRVGNLERSINFYTQVLEMQLLRRKDFPDEKFTLVFVGYGAEADHAVIELTHNWGVESYDKGNGFGHIAIAVDDIYVTCDRIRNVGGKITREPGPLKNGTTLIAFVEDPDGYMIELIKRK